MTRNRIIGSLMVGALVLLAPAAQAQTLRSQLYAQGFTNPIAFVQDPSMANVQYVVQQNGLILTIVNGAVSEVLFLDLGGEVSPEGGETGLLGLAFDPNPASGRFYVNFTRPGDYYTVVARFKRSAGNPLVADPASRFDLMWPITAGQPQRQPYIVQPFSNHNGGHLRFGPDGYLYIGLGDGGSGDDPDHRAQDPGTLLGKMLRIDVDVDEQTDPEGYDVPGTNPFLADPNVLPEIWSFGLRNPWRYSFDDGPGGTGALIIGDVGQGAWEEVDYEPAGAGGRNYGWRNREGAHAYIANPAPYFMPLTDPIHEYNHSVGRSITGGVVYRGGNLGAPFQGRYFFADFIFSRIWSLGLNIDGSGEATAGSLIQHTSTLGAAASNVSHIGVDANGEVYLVNYGGTIYRLYLDMTTNGSFGSGMAGWTTFATPDPSYFVGGVVNGVLEFYRNPGPPGPVNQAVVFQRTGAALAPSMPFIAQFDLGNSSSARKRIKVLVHDMDFNDLIACTFWLAPSAPLRTYRIFSHTIEAWTNATISFYAASAGSDGGAYRLDNVSLRADVSVSNERTDCFDPTVPGAPGGGDGPELVANGDFAGGLEPWVPLGQITSQVAGGEFQFYRPIFDPPGVVLQATGTGVPAGAILTATFDLGNSSSVRKRVVVILHTLDFSDITACTFWLAPGQPLLRYTMRSFATQAWANATVAIYPSTVGTEEWIRLDNVSMRRTPSQPTVGTECMEPSAGSAPAGQNPALRAWRERTTMALRRTHWFIP